MTFKDALQAEIDLQTLSVAQIAKDSNVSKGAIYNILNGTTEDARIRPATRKALAQACNREVRPSGDGVVFFDPSGQQPEIGSIGVDENVVLAWMANRTFSRDRHAGPAFDWLHLMEEAGKLEGLRVVDRVYQNRSDFLGLAIHNRGDTTLSRADLTLSVTYESPDLDHRFNVRVAGPLSSGTAVEETVFVCVGRPYSLEILSATVAEQEGGVASLHLPEPYNYPGGDVD